MEFITWSSAKRPAMRCHRACAMHEMHARCIGGRFRRARGPEANISSRSRILPDLGAHRPQIDPGQRRARLGLRADNVSVSPWRWGERAPRSNRLTTIAAFDATTCETLRPWNRPFTRAVRRDRTDPHQRRAHSLDGRRCL